MELPHITSRVNGMKIPFLPGQASILHRFEQPENKLFVSATTYNALLDQRDDANDLVIPATQEPGEAPRAHVSQTKPRPQTQPVADTGALTQAQARANAAEQELAALKAQLAAAKTSETKGPKVKAEKEPAVPAFTPPAIPAIPVAEGAVS
jgi:hypothetical protein